MTVTLEITYTDQPFHPAIYACDIYAAWKLWFELRESDKVISIVVRNGFGITLDFTKSFLEAVCCTGQQYRFC